MILAVLVIGVGAAALLRLHASARRRERLADLHEHAVAATMELLAMKLQRTRDEYNARREWILAAHRATTDCEACMTYDEAVRHDRAISG